MDERGWSELLGGVPIYLWISLAHSGLHPLTLDFTRSLWMSLAHSGFHPLTLDCTRSLWIKYGDAWMSAGWSEGTPIYLWMSLAHCGFHPLTSIDVDADRTW
jgi:hypothetical protein